VSRAKYWLRGIASRTLREGRAFRRLLAEMEANERLPLEVLQARQDRLLRAHVCRAARNVPYYRDLFARLGLSPEDIQTVDDLRRLPILEKEEVRGQEERFVDPTVLLKFKATTSGTTGKPLRLFRDYHSVNLESAALWRQRGWAGYGLGQRRATLRGDLIVPGDRARPPFWVHLPATRQLLMSSYHMSDAFLPKYLARLRAFRPAAVEAYPSSAYRLAFFMEQHGEEPLGVKGVFTSSEMVFDHQLDVIRRMLGPVFDYYGTSERSAMFCQCEEGRYHYAMDYSVVEFLPGRDGMRRVLGTTLHNAAMPFLRYDSGDLVEMDSEPCPCGRTFPTVRSIVGRQDDYVVTPSGRWLGRLNLIFAGVPNIIESQIVQERLDAVRILILPAPDFGPADRAVLVEKARKRLGSEVTFTIEEVDTIGRTSRGKYQLVVSHLTPEQTGHPAQPKPDSTVAP
jgi:phenylacetate-CoA ligase